MTLIRQTSIVLSLVALLAAPALAQSPSAKTQAVFTASQLGERCASDFKRYDRMKDGGRLLEKDSSGGPVHVGITKSLGSELSMAIAGYLKALDSGWDASDPELTKARETIQAVQARMEKVGVWTCFEWDEKRLPDGARDGLDKIRREAWEGTLLVQAGKIDEASAAFAFSRKLIEEHGEAIERDLDRGLDVVDTRKHPAYARTVAEVDRLQASVQDALDQVEGERERLRKDVAALHAVVEKAAPALREAQNSGSFSGTEDAIIEAVIRLREKQDAFESELGEEVRAALLSFTKRYGSDRDAIGASITRIMGGSALDVPQSPQFLVDGLNRDLSRVAESRKVMVRELVGIAESNRGNNDERRGEGDPRQPGRRRLRGVGEGRSQAGRGDLGRPLEPL